MDDHSQLQGRWRFTGMQVNGAEVPRAQLGPSSITIKDNRFTATGPGTLYEGDMTLDPRANPKRLSVLMNREADTITLNAIYEVKGDTLRLCLDVTGGPAPNAFTSSKDKPWALQTLQRERER